MTSNWKHSSGQISKRKSASSRDTRHLDVRVLHAPSAQQCFVLNGSEHHHYVKTSHLASFDTTYENTCYAVLQPGSHEWLHLVPARSSTSPTTAALCSYTDHVWAFGVWLVEHPPAQWLGDGRKSNRFLFGNHTAIGRKDNSCKAIFLHSLARSGRPCLGMSLRLGLPIRLWRN